jgi:hypothetical protein
MHTNGLTDNEHLARQRMDDLGRLAGDAHHLPPPRRELRRHTAARLRHLADFLER